MTIFTMEKVVTYNFFNFQTREITARNAKMDRIRQNIFTIDDEIQESDNNWKTAVQEEKHRDQDIFSAEQQKNKLDNDLQKLHHDFGDG